MPFGSPQLRFPKFPQRLPRLPLRSHGCLLHLDIIDGKIWIQRDGTEDGVALELEEAGIPKTDIVLAWHPAKLRPYTDYAAA